MDVICNKSCKFNYCRHCGHAGPHEKKRQVLGRCTNEVCRCFFDADVAAHCVGVDSKKGRAIVERMKHAIS